MSQQTKVKYQGRKNRKEPWHDEMPEDTYKELVARHGVGNVRKVPTS